MLTPEVCRAARGLLGWTLRQLSQASGVSMAHIPVFELNSNNFLLALTSDRPKDNKMFPFME